MHDFISVEEACSIVLDTVTIAPPERAPLAAALGRTLADTIISRENLPSFNNSAVDGYAVRAEDIERAPATLHITGTIAAGRLAADVVRAGACMQIMTGAPIPAGADAVIPVEWTESLAENQVVIQRSATKGQHIRLAGKDVAKGAVVFEPGEILTPPAIGMLAALGHAEVQVYARPRVAIVATGDELVELGQPLGPGQIYNSNGPALAAQVKAAGGDPVLVLTAKDDPASILSVVEQALQADMTVFSGGVSVGRFDFVKQVLDEAGIRMLFWRVRQKPGKPLAYGLLQGKPVFGLPGNPVSSAICFEQYVRPALARMLNRWVVQPVLHAARLETPIAKAAGLYHFVRGVASIREAGVVVRDTGSQDSNIYSSVLQANCLIHLPEDAENPPAGASVGIEWLRWD